MGELPTGMYRPVGGRPTVCRIALCEDTVEDRRRVEGYLSQIFDELGRPFRLACFASAEEFFAAAAPYTFDVVLFDVEMGDMDGIKAARLLRSNDKRVIIAFATSHPEYVFSSFSAEPLNYLLKPVRYGDLFDLVAESVRRIDETHADALSFEMKGVLYSVPVKEISYIESNARMLRLVSDQGEYSFYGKLDDTAQDRRLAGFIRCHKSFLVNPAFIERIDGGTIALAGGQTLPVSRSNVKRVKQEFVDYLDGRAL